MGNNPQSGSPNPERKVGQPDKHGQQGHNDPNPQHQKEARPRRDQEHEGRQPSQSPDPHKK